MISKRVRLTCCRSASTVEKSGLTVRSRLSPEVTPIFASRPMFHDCSMCDRSGYGYRCRMRTVWSKHFCQLFQWFLKFNRNGIALMTWSTNFEVFSPSSRSRCFVYRTDMLLNFQSLLCFYTGVSKVVCLTRLYSTHQKNFTLLCHLLSQYRLA